MTDAITDSSDIAVDLREQVARKIHPLAFLDGAKRSDGAGIYQSRVDDAFAKADAILALPELRALRLPGGDPMYVATSYCSGGGNDVTPPPVTYTPEGWVMVPREPTREMITAGDRKTYELDRFRPSDIYRAMLSAVPSPPKDQGSAQDAAVACVSDVSWPDEREFAGIISTAFRASGHTGPILDRGAMAKAMARPILNWLAENVRHLPAAPPQSEVPSAWRPMETAPMNTLLVVSDGGERLALSALEDTDCGGTYWALDGDGGLDWSPTFWTLPPTPDTGSSGINRTRGGEDE